MKLKYSAPVDRRESRRQIASGGKSRKPIEKRRPNNTWFDPALYEVNHNAINPGNKQIAAAIVTSNAPTAPLFQTAKGMSNTSSMPIAQANQVAQRK